MKLRNLIFAALASVALSVLSGCNSANDETAHQKSTFLGIYTYEPACYASQDPASFSLRTDEACGMELPSGDRTQFLWGLISIEDY